MVFKSPVIGFPDSVKGQGCPTDCPWPCLNSSQLISTKSISGILELNVFVYAHTYMCIYIYIDVSTRICVHIHSTYTYKYTNTHIHIHINEASFTHDTLFCCSSSAYVDQDAGPPLSLGSSEFGSNVAPAVKKSRSG